MELIIVLLTGLTTGGLTCLAVQGGLLASVASARAGALAPAVAQQPMSNTARRKQEQRARRQATVAVGSAPGPSDGPILAFLGAKLIAYTALGVLLGATGSLIGVSATTRGWLQLFAGLYMVATALNLLQIHPAFRYVVLQPPAFLTRRVRLVSKSGSAFAPASLGFMTVLIPCGTTLAVEFFALSTGSPLYAGALMFAFTLGTMPVFYFLGRLTTRMQGERQARFMGFTAAGVLLLGFLSINTAMNLLDYPFTYRDLETNLAALPERIAGRSLDGAAQAAAVPTFSPAASARQLVTLAGPTSTETAKAPAATAAQGGAEAAKAASGTDAQVLKLDVKSTAYTPARLEASAGRPIRLELATNNTNGCTRAFTIPSLGLQQILPVTGTTTIDLPAQKAGTIRFTCSMGMYSGSIVIS